MKKTCYCPARRQNIGRWEREIPPADFTDSIEMSTIKEIGIFRLPRKWERRRAGWRLTYGPRC